MFLPVGLDESRLARLPWISIAIAAACTFAWLAGTLGGSEEEVEARHREAVGYFGERPYLVPPASMERFLGFRAEEIRRRPGTAAPPGGALLALEQRELDSRVAAFLEAYESNPERRYALVPARGALQPGWLTHLFVHGGFLHLLGNMLVFLLVVGPFLEDAWGRPFFLAFYLAGGLAAGLAQALLLGSDSQIGVVGASGAISACLGAFALRFAHRRVRIFYWLLPVVRGTFFVPAWLYALGGAVLDLVGLKLGGADAPVAYAAHLGGFAFGMLVAAAVRATGLEERIAPGGAPRWAGSMGVARAAEAVSGGRIEDARGELRQALRARPDDEEALLLSVRLEVARLEVAAAHEPLERLLAQRLVAGDLRSARELMAEFRALLKPELLRPATAYRAAEALEVEDPELALAFLEAAGAGAGAIGAKALLRAATLLRATDPERAAGLAARAAARADAPVELRERAELLLARPPEKVPTPAPAPASARGGEAALTPPGAAADATTVWDLSEPGALGRREPVRLVGCRLLGAGSDGLDLVADEGWFARLPHAQVARVAVGVVERPAAADGRASLLVDLLLRAQPGEERVVVRIPGHAMSLGSLRPGLSPAEAFAAWMGELLAASEATPIPNAAAARGRPFARFADPTAFEEACHGRRLGAAG